MDVMRQPTFWDGFARLGNLAGLENSSLTVFKPRSRAGEKLTSNG
jgi:hypothetical protein